MPITTVIIISLLIFNLSMTLFMFWIIHDLLSAVKSLQDTEDILNKALDRNNQLIEQYDKCLDGVYKRETAMHDTIMSWCENAEKTYNSIKEAYSTMFEQYKTIRDIQTKLLECWKSCEERYSQSYEEFKHCSDKLNELSYQITDLANVSTEDEYMLTLNEACDTVCLDCPYEQCKKDVKYEDKMLDCPVWKIKSQQREIKAELEEVAEFEWQKAHHEWTDEDYLEAVNTHPEESDNIAKWDE